MTRGPAPHHNATMETDELRCALCGRRVHPRTGWLVGSPQRFPACGPCGRDLVGFLRDQLERRVRGFAFYDFVDRPGPDVAPVRWGKGRGPGRTLLDLLGPVFSS